MKESKGKPKKDPGPKQNASNPSQKAAITASAPPATNKKEQVP